VYAKNPIRSGFLFFRDTLGIEMYSLVMVKDFDKRLRRKISRILKTQMLEIKKKIISLLKKNGAPCVGGGSSSVGRKAICRYIVYLQIVFVNGKKPMHGL
jgi:hypothetical protein